MAEQKESLESLLNNVIEADKKLANAYSLKSMVSGFVTGGSTAIAAYTFYNKSIYIGIISTGICLITGIISVLYHKGVKNRVSYCANAAKRNKEDLVKVLKEKGITLSEYYHNDPDNPYNHW